MEVNVEWLPPLVAPIVADYKTITQPAIGQINPDTFAISGSKLLGNRGGFEWNLGYHEFRRLPTSNPADNFKVPVLLGAVMALNQSYFWELGGYDDQLEIWGGEQYEGGVNFFFTF